MKINGEKLFKYIWRFNALAIACAAVICMLGGGIVIIKLFKDKTRERHVNNIVNVGDQTEVKEEFSLGYPHLIEGTDYFVSPLYRDQSYNRSYYSKDSQNNEVNYVFLNVNDGSSNWLVKTTDQLFLSYITPLEKFPRPSDDINESKAVVIVYNVVEKDTNGDNFLSEKDKVSIYASAVNGSDYRKLAGDIDKFFAIKQVADDRLIILYQKNKENISEIYSLPAMKQISQQIISQANLK